MFISGGTGFLGGHLSERLLNLGYDVSNIPRSQAEFLTPEDADDLLGEIVSRSPKVIIHLAAFQTSSQDGSSLVRILGGGVILGSLLMEAALRSNALFVSIGSYWQYVNGVERSTVFYAAAKDSFNQLTSFYRRELGLRATEVVLFDTYGPRDNRNKLIPILLHSAACGRSVVLREPDTLINLTYVSDVVDAIVTLTRHDYPPKIVVRNQEFLRIDEVVGVVEKITQKRLSIQYSGESLAYRMTEPWVFGTVIPDWVPSVSLENGIFKCWMDLRFQTGT